MATVIRGTDDSVSAPAITGTDSDTGVYFPAANQVALATAGTQAIFVDGSQNVGFGTNSPIQKVHIAGTGNLYASGGATWYTGGDLFIRAGASGALRLGANDTNDFMRIASNGQQSSVVPGGGTLYPAFNCRSWVNFNGTGTVSIRGSGNVSSITDNGVGDYTVNYTTAMPDANYGVVGMNDRAGNANIVAINETRGAPTAGAVYIYTGSAHASGTSAGVVQDVVYVFVAIFR